MNLRRGAFLFLALLSLPLLSSCVSVLSPTGWSPVTFDGDTAYLTTSKGRLSALTLSGDSATAKWTFPDKDNSEDKKLNTKAIYGAPVVDGDRLYLATFHGGVFALDTGKGRPVWPNPEQSANRIDGDIAGGVAISEENVYFGTTEGKLYAWKKADGSAAWPEPKSFDGGIWATPVVSGDTVYVATMKGEVHALSASDGSTKWDSFKVSGAIAELTLIDEDTLFVPSVNRNAYLVHTSDGSTEAQFEAGHWLWTGAAFEDGRLYFGDFGGTVYGLDITSGASKVWEASVEGERVRAGPAIVDDVLVVADRKPTVTFISATDGEVLNRVPIPDAGTVRANLTVKDGAAYIATTNGKLFRANPENKSVIEIQLSGVKK